MDRDAPHLQESEVKESLRVVLSTLAKLILSAKVIKDSDTEINSKLQRDASEVLSAVRRFVVVCQSKNIGMEQINPKFIAFQAENDLLDKFKNKRKSSTTTSSITTTQKAKYPLNQDLIVNLQTHAKQIIGSTDALCKASSYIFSIEQKQNQPQIESDTVEEESHILDQRARSNVILLFQNLSSQIGNYLAILSDIDISQVGLLQVQSLPEFRCNKQKLYNSIGLLFSAVQTITDTELDLSSSVNTAEELTKSIEETIGNIAINVGQLVEERKVWLTKNGHNMNDGGPWSPPAHSYFESDNKKGGPNRGNIMDENSEVNMPEELNSPRLQRLYNRQQQTQAKQSTNTSVTTLSRLPEKPLTRQFSFAQQGNVIPEEKTQFWFLRYDYAETDIEFTQEGGIKGGTLRALVERLTLHDFIGKKDKK
jgi:hypothetical protein